MEPSASSGYIAAKKPSVKPKYRACFMGASLDTGNMGVTALGTSLVALVNNRIPDAEISLFIGRRDQTPFFVKVGSSTIRVPVINFRLSLKARPGEHLVGLLFLAAIYRIISINRLRKYLLDQNPRLKAIFEADFVGDIRGGDSFSDIYGLKGFVIGSLPAAVALLLGKDLILLPQTYGPYKSWTARRLSRVILKRAKIILSRDKAGLQVVEDILGSKGGDGRVHLCPDVAFSLESRTVDPIPVQPDLKNDRSIPVVGLNVSGLLYNGGFTRANMFDLAFDYKKFVQHLVEKILRETDARLLLVPHTFAPRGNVESDNAACEEVFQEFVSRYPDRIHVVTNECGASEIKGIIGLCDFFIGSRMHSCIGALSQGIPTVGVAYSRKFLGVFDSVGVGHLVVDARSMNESDVISKILSAFNHREQEKAIVCETVGAARTMLDNMFRKLLAGESLDCLPMGRQGMPPTREILEYGR